MIQSATSSPRLIAALAYAAAGIPIFPCKADRIHACVVDPKTGKCPICNALKAPATPNSFRDATTDQSIIRGWWAEADYNLAVCPEDAGWCVFDADGAAGIAEAKEAGLPDTYTVGSPSDGEHYYYDGSLPPTVKKFAPHIDTRGRGSYVLQPPSVINGRHYWVKHNRPIVPVREADVDRVKATERHLVAADDVTIDSEWMIDLARDELQRLVKRGEVAGPGNRDEMTFKVACKMLEMGLSRATAAALMHDIWEPACEDLCGEHDDLIEWKLASAADTMQNDIGSKALPDPASWGVENLPPPPPDEPEAPPKDKRRYQARKPSEDANKPPIKFFDDHRGTKCLMPRVPGGVVVVVIGQENSHKSGVVLKECVDAMINKGARVLYIATEGAHGIQTARLPAIAKHRGMAIEEFDDKWRTIDEAIDILDANDLNDLIEEYTVHSPELKPDIVVIDVLTLATGGADINHPTVGAGIVLACQKIARAFDCLAIDITHPGKDVERGAIGSKQLENLSYGRWTVSEKDGLIKVFVTKMKDARARFMTFMRVHKLANGVPVVVDVSAEEQEILEKNGPTPEELREKVYELIYYATVEGKTVTSTNKGYGPAAIARKFGVEEQDIADALVELMSLDRIKLERGHGYQLCHGARAPGGLN